MSIESEHGLEYIRGIYRVPAYKGTDVIIDGRRGEIVGSSGQHVLVRFRGSNDPLPCHPTWHATYLNKHGFQIWPDTTDDSRIQQAQRTAVKP